MAGPYIQRLQGLAVKRETVSGTDAVPTAAANAIATVGFPTITIDYLDKASRDDVQTAMLVTAPRAKPAGRWAKIEGTAEIKGAGAPYSISVRPEIDPILVAGGMAVVTDFTGGGESYQYFPADSGFITATAYAWAAGKLFKLVGCVATFSIALDVNKRGMLKFTLTGRLASDPTETALPAFTYNSVLPPVFNGTESNIGSYATDAGSDPLVLLKMGLDCGNEITPLPSAGATDGHAGYVITDRKAKLTATLDVPALASIDPFALSKAVGSANGVTGFHLGSTQYDDCTINTGRWEIEPPKLASGKIMTYDLSGELKLGASVNGREFELIFA